MLFHIVVRGQDGGQGVGGYKMHLDEIDAYGLW